MRRTVLAATAFALACFAATQPAAEDVRVETATYSSRLSDDWVEAQSTDAEQRTFDSRSRDVHLVVSSSPGAIPPERFEEIARFVVERRIELEREIAARRGQRVAISGPVVISEDWGTSMSYTGAFSGGRTFSYSGSVTRTQVFNLYVESASLSHQELIAVVQEVTSGLDFTF